MLNINGTRFLTTREAATMLGLSEGHLRNCRSQRRSPIPYLTVGRSVIYTRAAVVREAQRRKAARRGRD